MPICTAVLTAALLAGPAASPADPVPAAHKSFANKTTKQLRAPEKNSGKDAARHSEHKVATPATQVEDDPVQESSAWADTGASDSGSEKAAFQKSESWSSDPHAGGDSQVREAKKTRKSGQAHHGKNGKKSSTPRAEQQPAAKNAVDAPAAPAAAPAEALVIKPAVAPAAKPAVVPAVKQTPAEKQDSSVKQAPVAKIPSVKQAPVVKQAQAVKHAPEPRPALAPAVEAPKAAEAPLVKNKEAAQAPAVKPAQKTPAVNDAKTVEAAKPEGGQNLGSTQAQEAPAADAAPLSMPAADSKPRDVMINPSGMPLPVNPYLLPAMPGLQRSVARPHRDHGHVGLLHPNQRGHGKS
jgi:hypothetical protein